MHRPSQAVHCRAFAEFGGLLTRTFVPAYVGSLTLKQDSQKTQRKSTLKDMKRRHYFFLNPYQDCAFTKCPQFDAKTKIR
ncbi:MAG: hypothetical protein D3917_10430 [Candidatus Electrothrix sp. AX5]|nr:hypothetical protein [Candidatus Electrothrix sp. AX5]